MINFPRI